MIPLNFFLYFSPDTSSYRPLAVYPEARSLQPAAQKSRSSQLVALSLPANTIILPMVARSSPECAVFPIEIYSVDGAGCAFIKSDAIAHLA